MPQGSSTDTAWRADMRDYLTDLLTFIEEQIELAKKDPADQCAAVDAARGVIPLIRRRVREDPAILACFMLNFSQQFEGAHWLDWWSRFAKAGPQDFSEQADQVLEAIDALRTLLSSTQQSSPRN